MGYFETAPGIIGLVVTSALMGRKGFKNNQKLPMPG
jgi:hypothetical protein